MTPWVFRPSGAIYRSWPGPEAGSRSQTLGLSRATACSRGRRCWLSGLFGLSLSINPELSPHLSLVVKEILHVRMDMDEIGPTDTEPAVCRHIQYRPKAQLSSASSHLYSGTC